VIYGEPWSAGWSPLRGEWTTKQTVRGTKIGAFNDHFRNALKGSPDGHEPGFIQNGSHMDGVRKGMEGSFRDWADQPWHSINYMTCHDNLVLYDKLQKSRADVGETEWLDMMKLGYVALFTAQGVPFIHGGEEFARTKQGHHNSYNAPDSINQVDWALKKKNHALFRYVRDLVQVRRDHPVFRMRAKEQIAAWTRFVDLPDSDAVMWLLDAGHVDGESWKSAAVLLNASDSMSVDVPLPPGRWSVVLDHNGAVTQPRAAEGTVRVRYKSGMILSQP
jgi:pullulanase